MSLQDTIEQLNSFDINEIDWSRIGVWPLIVRVSIVILMALVLVFGVYFMYMKDLNAQYKKQVNKEQTLKRQFQTKAFESATLEQHRAIMEKLTADFELLVDQLPEKTQVPDLLDDIDEKGRVSGLDIVSVKLQSEKQGEFYITLPIEVIVTGSYHNIGTFISGISGMARIVTLHNFTISGGKPGELKLSVDAQTYRSLDEENL